MRLLRCLLLALPGLPALALAHQPGSSFLIVRAEGEQLHLRWDVALADADLAVGLDRDRDGVVAPAEAGAGEAALFAYAGEHLAASGPGGPCSLSPQRPLQVAEHRDGRHLVLRFTGRCPQPVRELQLTATLMHGDRDPAHRVRARVQIGDHRWGRVFSAGRAALRLDGPGRGFADYFREGIAHVLGGADHLLFLAGLFLPAVLRRADGRWQPQPAWRPVVRRALALVSAFTVAHALTLCLAALGVLSLPTRWVESAVAASVLFTGLNNLWPMVPGGGVWLAAGFGLIHGSAIAGALLELGLPAGGRVQALLGFNLGVELAQLALVALLLPLAWPLRASRFYRWGLFWPGSALVALAGAVWLTDRALALDLALPV